MIRPYKLLRDYRPAGAPSVAAGCTVACYQTLAAAVAGARRLYRRHPDESLEIRAHGRTQRSLYHHGLPSDRRWDG